MDSSTLQVHWPKLLISIENISLNLTGNFFVSIASPMAQRSGRELNILVFLMF